MNTSEKDQFESDFASYRLLEILCNSSGNEQEMRDRIYEYNSQNERFGEKSKIEAADYVTDTRVKELIVTNTHISESSLSPTRPTLKELDQIQPDSFIFLLENNPVLNKFRTHKI